MDSKLPPTRLPEDLVQQQISSPAQQFAPRNPVGQPVPQLNPIARRPSVTYSTGELPIRAAPPPQTLQRLDSRQSIQLQPQQQYQNTNQVPGGQLQQPRIIQQRPIGAPTPQPQYQQQAQQLQQQPRIENPNRPQLISRAPAPNPIQQQLINRPAIPPGSQLPPQQQVINRLPLNRPPAQNLPQTQTNQAPIGYQQQQPQQQQQQQLQLQQQQQQQGPIRIAGPPQLAPNQYSVTSANGQQNQNLRLNQPGQYRPPQSQPQPQQYQAPIQPRPPTFNNPISQVQKLPTHLEERSRMASEINAGEKHQPSYIISNSDDVDDVIVRPITQSSVFDTQPKVQQVQQPYVGQQQPPQRPAPNVNQSEFRQSPQQQQVPIARPPTTSPPNANSPSVLKSSTPEPSSRSSIPRPAERIDNPANISQKAEPPKPVAAPSKPAPDNVAKKQNGTSGKADEKGSDDGAAAGRLSQSRASSHKSQEDVMQRSSSRSRMLKLLEKPAEPPKKVSMNKVKVGNAPPPNLRQVRSKIGSLDNATHKPGGGNIKIETKKLEFKVQPRIEAKNEAYAPKGGDKKIISNKLQWNAKSKIGSLDNANHKPGGGDKKILTIKSDFRENAKPKVGSKSANNNNNNNDAAAAETVNQ